MKQLPTGEPVWDLKFDEKGGMDPQDRQTVLNEINTTNLADLFIFSHGWGTAEQDARDLYDTMFPLIRDAATSAPNLGPMGFAGIYWPSLWFPDTPATPPQPVGSTQAGPLPSQTTTPEQRRCPDRKSLIRCSPASQTRNNRTR